MIKGRLLNYIFENCFSFLLLLLLLFLIIIIIIIIIIIERRVGESFIISITLL